VSRLFWGSQQPLFPTGGVYLKKSEPILLTGSAGGRAKTEPPFRPTTPKSGSGKDDFKFFAGGSPQGKS